MKSPMEILRERNSRFQTKESTEKGRNFTPRPTDIFVVTYPKCGTTWVTQLIHGLRSNGDISFNEITEVCPWDCLALDCGQDVDADQKFSPRLFKSHEVFEDIAKLKLVDAKSKSDVAVVDRSPNQAEKVPGKVEKSIRFQLSPVLKSGHVRNGGPFYVHVARDPLDAFVSFYNFLPPYCGVSLDDISMSDFCKSLFGGASNSGNIWDFYISWYRALEASVRAKDREDANLKGDSYKFAKHDAFQYKLYWVFFEDLKADLSYQIFLLSLYLNLPDLEGEMSKQDRMKVLDIAQIQAGFSFMEFNASKFDDHFVFNQVKARMGIPDHEVINKPLVGKVRSNKAFSKDSVPEDVREMLKQRWKDTVEKELGFKSYVELKAAVKKLQENVVHYIPGLVHS